MFSQLLAISTLALLAVGEKSVAAPAATTTAPPAIFTVAVPLGLGPENAIFNAGIIGSDATATTITYSLAEDVLEAVTATINPKSLIQVQEGGTQTCTLTPSASSVLCTFPATPTPFEVVLPLTTVPILGPTVG
ncbi:hypothetical protein FB45DRAFT_1059531 [Roridomyces roridus]|uniref:Uncharacterized protein n=1 Tax=Roridomyces roridus TaxID=1738132 RepID=A0AAD7FNE5_9AGAR|nr:hypothetical protein FB45DRAFT_1059531 [Roridomyces roridus]